MKVLLVHNEYGKYSGEEAVVDKMAVMLIKMGHEVAQFRRSTAEARESLLGKIHGFMAGIYCPEGVNDFREALRRECPDVVNVHNLYPFISPAALRECKKTRVPVVMTVHNFRLICPTGLFMRDNVPCEFCLKRGNEWGCVRFNCENSMLKSIGYAARNSLARLRRHYIDCVDIFACITDFQRRKLIEAGYDKDKIVVIPNSIDVDDEANEEYQSGNYVAFSGRISREKGVDLIMEVAHRHPEIQFRLAGAVRDASIIADRPDNVELVGYLSGNALNDFYKNARFFVMASRCYEGFPMTILEAANYSKPMIAPDHGGFTEIIGRGSSAIGHLFTPTDINAFEKSIVDLWNNEKKTSSLGKAAHYKLIKEYSAEVISQKWDSLLRDLCM